MSLRRVVTIAGCALLLLLAAGQQVPVTVSAGEGFQPISPEELKMTSEPLAPGAPAVILYRQFDRDDNDINTHEYDYFRIKILTEEGRKYANVEIPFIRGNGNVSNIRARTIRPDGSIAELDGKVLEQSLVKSRGGEYLAKTFTLPDVQIGSILEYCYTQDYRVYALYETHWILSEELFTKNARFSLRPYHHLGSKLGVRWSWQNLPPGLDQPKEGSDHIIRMEANHIPAFQTEEFMPPPNELKARVDFTYDELLSDRDVAEYWKRIGKERNSRLETFVGKRKAMEEAVAQIVSPNDPSEMKLRKIYDRVQQIRNTSFELRKTEQEEKREKEKVEENVEELWKQGYGNGQNLTWLYLALVRAAGFEAYGCWVADRQKYFFSPDTMQSGKLDANVVLVKSNGKDLYFDPGALFTPFGLLGWSETGVTGLRLDKDGGSWIQTPLPASSESRIEHKATLKLSDTGDLEGSLTVTYTGLEAMYHRLEVHHSDDVARRKSLEDRVKKQVPGAVEVELKNKPDWDGSETPLVAEFDVKINGWASSAGKRALLPAGVFTAVEKSMFEHADRVHPVYFEYPYEKVDDVSIALPSGWRIDSVPKGQDQDARLVAYALKVESNNGTVHLGRKLKLDFTIMDTKYYPALRSFFQFVRTSDEEQIVLLPGAATASN